MADILGAGVSGLMSFQRALSTTSHNIANVNTDGYSKQRVDLETVNPNRVGSYFIGNGVQINTIERMYDQFITSSIREVNAEYSRLEKFTQLAGEIDNLLADPEGGISPILQEFFGTIQDLSDDPTSGSARVQLLSIADSLVNRFATFDARLEELSKNTETDIANTVDEINQLASAIGEINLTIQETSISGAVTQQSSDLLDRRDALLEELSSKVSIQVINESEPNMTVLIGNGQTMVSGSHVFALSVQPAQADPSQSIIVYDGFSSTNDLSGQLNGGELGGLLDYRSSILSSTINSLGRVAIGFADSFNSQHRQGMDLENNLGGDFFSFSQPRTIANSANAGAAPVSTTITDISQLTASNYQLDFDGINWTITSEDGSSGTIIPPSGSFEGLTVSIGAGAAAGDSFIIKPTADGAGSIQLAISNPNLIAAAAPIRTQSSLDNLGNIEISQGIITDGSSPAAIDPATFSPVTFTFESPPTTFTSSVNVIADGVLRAAGASIPYSNNMVIESTPGAWQVSLSGTTPQTGDTLSIEANLGGTGDNRNMLALGSLQTAKVFDSGTRNYQEAYSVLVGSVGAATHSASANRDAEETLLGQAVDRRSQVSGVNLDEEAADLIKFQQAYEAAARVIQTAQTLFDTLINATR